MAHSGASAFATPRVLRSRRTNAILSYVNQMPPRIDLTRLPAPLRASQIEASQLLGETAANNFVRDHPPAPYRTRLTRLLGVSSMWTGMPRMRLLDESAACDLLGGDRAGRDTAIDFGAGPGDVVEPLRAVFRHVRPLARRPLHSIYVLLVSWPFRCNCVSVTVMKR